MARKSVVKDIRDIFESDSNKSPTAKYFDEKHQRVKDNQNDELRKNRKLQPSKSKDSLSKYTSNEAFNKTNYKRTTSNWGSLKEKIDKFNMESTPSRASNSTVTMNETQNKNGPKRQSSKRNNLVSALRNNELPNENPSIKIGKRDVNNFEKISNDFQSTLLTPKNNNNEKNYGSIKKEIEILAANNMIKKLNEESADKITDNLNVNKKLPVIAAKPKYINKIKPHPDMSLKAKSDLLEKIKIFNEIAHNDSGKVPQQNGEDYSKNYNAINENSRINSLKKPTPPPKIISARKFVRSPSDTSSAENHYDVVEIRENKFAPKPISLEDLNNAKTSRVVKSVAKRNAEDHIYDVVQSSERTIKGFKNIHKSNSDKSVYDIVQKSNRSNTNKNAKIIQGKSLEDLEDDGYLVVLGSDIPKDTGISYEDMESDNSSEDEMATEYDVIENLNVTKITVERRYKIPFNDKEDSTFNVKRETYYDHNLNPRIERISRHTQKNHESSIANNNVHNRKSLLVIQELIQTELAYFKGLLRVYEDYIVYFKENPNACTPNIWKVFGNFEEIYKRQFEFYGDLAECNNDVDAIAIIFLKNESLFTLYESYIVNRHTSVKYSLGECFRTIHARDQELGNKLNLDSYLLTPFQRLLRYRLLLKNLKEAIEMESTPSCRLDDALNFLENFIEGTNIHAKVIQGIQNSPIDLSGKGKLLMIDDCLVKNNGKKYRSTVILFEDIIIFTRKVNNIAGDTKVESETYTYKNSINLCDLYVRSIAEDLTSFQLQNFPEFRLKHDNKYVFDVEVSDPKTKQEWVKKMESLLWNQFAAHKRS